MKNPSGSSLERGTQCPASFALDQARSTGADAIKGVENHDGIEVNLVAGETSKHEVVRQAVDGATGLEVEVAYAIDVFAETAREIGKRIKRDYGPVADTEIVLTLDLKAARPDGTWVWDWKSRERVTPALRNLQLRAACVAVMLTEGHSRVHGGIGYLDNDEADVHTFDAFDAATFFADMRLMLNRIGAARALVATGGKPEVHTGSWCKYCPAIAYCPAHTRLAMSMLGELDFVEKEIAFMTAEQAGKSWVLLRQIQTLADKVEASLRLRARQDVVPLPNGKRLALVEKSRASFDNKKAKAWIVEHGGDLKSFEGRTHFEQVMEINMPPVVATDRE